ncbi:MAG: hypothetical protein II889_00275 [Clostridia bacterium]|nr:hypothetical protein [Clostridia bacterium]
MEKKKKLIVILSAVIGLLAVFLVLYHLPRTLQWTGTAESHVNGVVADGTAELEIDLRMWPKLFRAPEFTGSVTVNGKRYVDFRDWGSILNKYTGKYYETFVPETLIEGKHLDGRRVWDDYLIIYRNSPYLQIVAYQKQEQPFAFLITGFYTIYHDRLSLTWRTK